MINESDYKRIYNVAECAGITDTTFDYTEETRAKYEKIADWINNDEFLGSIFTAEVTDTGVSSNRYYYLLKLNTQWNCGLFYGSPTLSYYQHTVGYFGYQSGGSFTYSTKSFANAIDLAYLRLMVIQSPYGIIADFYDCRSSTDKQINMLFSWGKDNADSDKRIAFWLGSSIIYIISNSIHLGYYSLKTRSSSARTGLLTYMVEKTDIVCDKAKLCDGALINNQAFFEVDGETWCCIRSNDDYMGLALRIT